MRYKSADVEALDNDIAYKINDLKQADDDYEIFVKSIDLAEKLTIAEREVEAIKLLEPYIETEAFSAEDEDLAWLYLNYATANQYDSKHQIAEQYYKKALLLSKRKKWKILSITFSIIMGDF